MEPSGPVQVCNLIALPFCSIGMTYDAYLTKPNTVGLLNINHVLCSKPIHKIYSNNGTIIIAILCSC